MDLVNLESEVFDLISEATEQVYTFALDLSRDYSRWSKNAVEYFGLPGEYIENTVQVWLSHIYPEDRPAFLEDFDRVLRGESKRHDCEYRIRNAKGEYVWVQSKGAARHNPDGSPRSFAAVLSNLDTLAKFDPLTGLLNTQEGMAQLARNIAEGKSGVLMLFGLDNFTRINDLYGFGAGDQILRLAGKEIQALHCGQTFRMDGDKAMCLIPDCNPEVAEYIYSEVQEIFQNVPRVMGMPSSLSVSCGVVHYPEDGTVPGELRTRAEHALEIAKRGRLGGLTRYSANLHQEAIKIFELQEMLTKAVQNDCVGFFLNYQPLVSNDEKTIFGAEALLRFSCPELNRPFVSPAEFIPLLEQSGMINTVGAWVLRTALKQTAEWRKFMPDFCVSVNVSYEQMTKPGFRDIVLSALQENGVSPDGLILELTESCRYLELQHLQETFDFFAQQGIKVALDDFGTGYSSVDALRTLTPPWIKLDHTFVASIGKNPKDEAIIEYLIQLCRHIDIEVCVEGIENQEILEIVQKYRPSLLQGYYFSKPLSEQAFAKAYIGKGA